MSLKSRWRLFVWALLIVAAAVAIGGATRPAPAGPQARHEWKELTLLYLSDVKGKIEPCG